ncbi:alpha/beta hydrolase [Micrococcus endophyticus]|uniref:alpha/beta hydrolase n=1 Tax=Micrococcus endophyticus TaxID=455343 RepID=UPI0020069C5C|nr:esterase [Micrococcus endophyticus]MCK6091081.1 esterase [Micrococcus endophyticus]
MPSPPTTSIETLRSGHPVVWSRPAAERPGTDLVLVLHGYGSNEVRAANRFFPMLPERCTGLAVRGGFEIDAAATEGPGDPGAHGWFLLDLMLQSDFAQVVAAAHRVFDVLASEEVAQARFRTVSVLGFSQGMAMATTLIRLRPEAFACGVGLSGFVVDNELLAVLDSPPEGPGPRPFFWGRDVEDPVIHPDAVAHTRAWAEEHTLLTVRTYPGVLHGIGPEAVRDVRIFLEHSLRAATPGS